MKREKKTNYKINGGKYSRERWTKKKTNKTKEKKEIRKKKC